jgi:hypothetical protein
MCCLTEKLEQQQKTYNAMIAKGGNLDGWWPPEWYAWLYMGPPAFPHNRPSFSANRDLSTHAAVISSRIGELADPVHVRIDQGRAAKRTAGNRGYDMEHGGAAAAAGGPRAAAPGTTTCSTTTRTITDANGCTVTETTTTTHQHRVQVLRAPTSPLTAYTQTAQRQRDVLAQLGDEEGVARLNRRLVDCYEQQMQNLEREHGALLPTAQPRVRAAGTAGIAAANYAVERGEEQEESQLDEQLEDLGLDEPYEEEGEEAYGEEAEE